MDNNKKAEILKEFKEFFKQTIAKNHLRNLRKLKKLSAFDYNPFLFTYKATFLTGNDDVKSLAKALIYPRILGSSIDTSFGQNMQTAAPNILKSIIGSTTSGIDIEFVDQIDKRKKYCQIKSGPNTINKDDVETISRHFKGAKNLARTNALKIEIDDFIVGVLYGTVDQLHANYRKIMEEYPVLIGKDFWHRLTGDEGFYSSLIEVFAEAAKETKGKNELEKVIVDLAKDIEENFVRKELRKK